MVPDACDRFKMLGGPRCDDALFDQGRVSADRTEWRAQFMTDHPQETTLGLVGFLRDAPRFVGLRTRMVALEQRFLHARKRLEQLIGFGLEHFLRADQLLLGSLA